MPIAAELPPANLPGQRRGNAVKIIVTDVLTSVTCSVTYQPTSLMIGALGPAGSVRGEVSGARGRTCNPLPGGIGHQPAGTTTGARGAIAGLGQVRAGNARFNCARSSPPGWGERTGPSALAASQEAWPGAEPLATRVPWARAAVERRQSCASRLRRGRARWHGIISIASVGVSPPNVFVLWFANDPEAAQAPRGAVFQRSPPVSQERPMRIAIAVLRTAMPGGHRHFAMRSLP